jgi:hypothetical protein
VKSPTNIIWHFSRQLLIGLFALLSCAPILKATPESRSAATEEQQNFLRLKERFETLAQRYSDPIILTCLAVETTAATWTLAVSRLTDDPVVQLKWQTKAAEFEKSWSTNRDWDARHSQALKIYYEALSEVARKMADTRQDGRRNAELIAGLESVLEQTDRNLSALTSPLDAYLEKEILSYGLMSLADIIVRSLGLGLNQTADLILAEVAEETEFLRERKGLHYRARLAFIYNAQVQGLTDLIFLLGPAAGPPLSRPLAETRTALDKAGADPRLPTTLSLIWTAQAQASLPLAYWLSTRPRAGQGGHL